MRVNLTHLRATPLALKHPLGVTPNAFEQITGRSDESLPVNEDLKAKAINDWIAVYSLPLVVPFSQVCFFCFLLHAPWFSVLVF